MLIGVLPCRVGRSAAYGEEVVEKIRAEFPGHAFADEIREDVRLAECPSHRRPITAYAPQSIGVADYRELIREVVAHR